MSSVDCLREFVNERLTAAAEEIFGVFKRTIVEYEEEIDRQRRLLDLVCKPELKLHRIELEEVLADEQLINQESNSSLYQDDPEPPEIKEEQEELCSSQDGEQLVLKHETDIFMLTTPNEDSVHSEPGPKRDLLFFHYSHVAENQDPKGGKHADSGTTRDEKPEPRKGHEQSIHHSNTVYKSNLSDFHCDTQTGKTSFKCDTCGKTFKGRSGFQRHMFVHTGEKPYPCKTCGKVFSNMSALKVHMRIHTGEKPFSCKTCGKDFRYKCDLRIHMRTHTGEKPYLCQTCGNDFRHNGDLRIHMRTHTGEKPYSCSTCEKTFCRKSQLKRHIRIHTG
uniref:zinc finger protein 566-like n=1 Tax=Semicossyphus pulcher TaxID=241346 RepID=UPI0037E86C13